MRNIVNPEIFIENDKISAVLDDLQSFHEKKGVVINQLLNYTGDKLSVQKWHDVALKLIDCGTFIEYDTVDNRIVHANFCRQRCCPMCQRRRSLELYSRLKANTEQMFGYELLHVVLTCQNVTGHELSDKITQLLSCSRKLFNMAEFKKAWKGEARFLEVTYSDERNDFHPHLHILVLVKPSYFKSRYYISQERLQASWSDVMSENCFAYVSKADSGALAEVAKYCVKPFQSETLDKNIKSFTMIFEALHGRRTYQLFGEFRKFNKIFTESDNIAGLDDVEIINDTLKFSYDGFRWHSV